MPRWTTTAGSTAALRLEDDDDSGKALEEGQIRVNVRACGLNFADIFAAMGLYSATPKGRFTPGLEFSGVVSEVHPSVASKKGSGGGSKLKVGDAVMGVTRFGGYTTVLNVGAAYVRPLPKGWSFSQGASFLCTTMTAWYGLDTLGGLRKGHTVLVHSAAGGVGLAATEICKAKGARVLATIGSLEKVSLLKERYGLSAEDIIVRGTCDFGKKLDECLEGKEGIDIVMDSLQGPYFQPAFSRLSRGGRHIVFGAAHMTPPGQSPNWIRLAWQLLFRPSVDPLDIIAQNRSVMGFNLIWMWDKEKEMSGMLEGLMTTLEWLPPHVGREFAFGEAKEAMAYLQSGRSTGKVVLTIPEAS